MATGAQSRNDSGGSVSAVLVAEFQADAVMMGQSVAGESLMTMTNDADIPILAGDSCIAIKEYTTNGSIKMVSTSNDTIGYARDCLSRAQTQLPEEERSKPTHSVAKYPIFDGVKDRQLRAIMMLILGCDVCLKGVPHVGAKKLNDLIKITFPQHKTKHPTTTLHSYLGKYIVKQVANYDAKVVDTYLQALVYEPTNIDTLRDGTATGRSYLDDPPTKLPKYLEEF